VSGILKELTLAATGIASMTALAVTETDNADLAITKSGDMQIQEKSPDNCPKCNYSLLKGSILYDTPFAPKTHGFGGFWIHTCSFQRATIKRIVECSNVACTYSITEYGIRELGHGKPCTEQGHSNCDHVCTVLNGDSW
jgi:hypothetical protein